MAEDIAVQESSILSEAVTSSESAFWVVAKNEEIESLHKTWDLVKLQEGTKTVGLRRSLYGLEQFPGQWYKCVLCIVGNFHVVVLLICCSL